MKRGFGSPNYNRDRAREVQRRGAQAIHDQGKAHKWTAETAAEAGHKGGNTRVANLAAKQEAA